MTRVVAVVEGQTERRFIEEVLGPALPQVGLTARILGKPGHKGGNPKYERVESDVLRLLRGDRSCYCTTMLDYYGLSPDFPGTSSQARAIQKVRHIEIQFKKRIESKTDRLRSDLRFIPYIQVHEFEALLFSDPGAFAAGIKRPDLSKALDAIRREFGTPEDIDLESPPSHRLRDLYPGYSKVVDGILAAQSIALERMRSECPHFREWLEKLESLAPVSTKP